MQPQGEPKYQGRAEAHRYRVRAERVQFHAGDLRLALRRVQDARAMLGGQEMSFVEGLLKRMIGEVSRETSWFVLYEVQSWDGRQA